MINVLTYITNVIKNKKNIQPFIIINENNYINYNPIKLIAKFTLCIKKIETKCITKNLCISCKKFNYNQHPDYYEINSNKNNIIQISNIKNLLQFLQFKPIISKYKTIVINTINNMNIKAYNSILKTLEEPPNNTLFLIIATNKNIAKTILERCYIINIKKNIYKNTKIYSKILYEYLLNDNLNYKSQININFFYTQSKIEQLNLLFFMLSNLIKKEDKNDKKTKFFKLITLLLYYKFLLKKNYNLDITLLINLIKINLNI